VVPTLLGQQLFPVDYPWNQNIAGAPVAANSAAIIAHIGSSITIHPDWGEDNAANGSSPLYGIPFNVVHGNATARVNVIIDNYPGESDLVPVPLPANPVIEGDYQNGPNPLGGGYNPGQRGDSHLIVWDEDNNIAYEFYGVTRPSDPKLFPDTNGVEAAHTDGLWHAAQESVWDMKTDNFRQLSDTSADAAGLSILAGLVRPDEGLSTLLGGQGAINHALRFTLPKGDVSPQYIYPASHVVNASLGATQLPLGARLRLMNTAAVNSLISTLGPEAQIIARAMKQYGLVLADIGSAMYVTGSSASEDGNNVINFTWDMNDVLGLSALTAGNFEVVDLTPAVTGLSAGTATPGSTITLLGRNFSGAAGHLAVLFGSTVAASATFIDDSHVTAVVPSGAGTVDVRVQSGIPATDPNNASDNVTNPIFGYGISLTSAADQFTFQTGGNPTGPEALFVTQLYHDLLGRAPDSTGLATWTGLLDQGTVTRQQTAAALVSSQEFQTNEVSHLYQSILGRPADQAGLQVWVNYLAKGGTAAQEEAQLLGSVEFFGKAGGTNSAFLAALFQDVLHRPIDPTGASAFGQALAAGVSRTTVAQQLMSSQEADVVLVEGLYQQYLHRPVDTAGLQVWISTLQHGGTAEQIVVSLTASQEYAQACGGDANLYYVQHLFVDLLKRPLDTSGFVLFVGGLDSGQLTRTQLVQAIIASGEYRSGVVQDLYRTYLHRAADPASLAGLTTFLASGGTDEQIAGMLVASAEFAAASGGTNAGFIDALYRDALGRPADSGALAAWTTALQNGVTRAQLAALVFASPEYLRDVVQQLYQARLRRPPDGSELTSWVASLSHGTRDETLTVTLAASVEYFKNS
jgi:hypothetical protein